MSRAKRGRGDAHEEKRVRRVRGRRGHRHAGDGVAGTATFKAGGSVNFVIAGLHQIAVYGPGTSPSDINVNLTQPMPGAPASLLVINDPANRIYRGPFPFALPRDRTEVVQFSAPGLHLVICAFLPHFVDEMWGWVKVLP